MVFRSPIFAIAMIVAASAPLPPLDAQDAPLRLLVSNGMKSAIEELRPPCERAIGRPLDLQFASTAVLNKQIQAGENFDVTIITSEAIADLIKQGKLATDPRAELARSELGIGIRAGALRPDIRTPEALKQTLRNSMSVTYPKDGATRGFIEAMFERLGIAADIKPRLFVAPSSGASTESVAAGKSALVITLFSEIVPVQGLEILGPLPGEFHYDIRFAAAVNTASRNIDAARALVTFLAGPRAAAVYKSKGLTPAD